MKICQIKIQQTCHYKASQIESFLKLNHIDILGTDDTDVDTNKFTHPVINGYVEIDQNRNMFGIQQALLYTIEGLIAIKVDLDLKVPSKIIRLISSLPAKIYSQFTENGVKWRNNERIEKLKSTLVDIKSTSHNVIIMCDCNVT